MKMWLTKTSEKDKSTNSLKLLFLLLLLLLPPETLKMCQITQNHLVVYTCQKFEFRNMCCAVVPWTESCNGDNGKAGYDWDDDLPGAEK